MQTKHTPGEWHLGRRAARTAIYGPVGEEIAVILETMNPDENLANAHLIAAAPELLAALDGMLQWARRVKCSNPGMEVANARAAIAKATGTL